MRASIPTLLPLFDWAKNMGINPWEFAQIGTGFAEDSERQCNHVWFQYPWQQNFLSREEIATSIAAAEERIAFELGYWPAPKYIEQTVEASLPKIRNLYDSGYNARSQPNSLNLDWKKVHGGGVLARTLVNGAGAVVLSDNDGDSINDKFTITVATTVTNPLEIGIYIDSTDRNSEPVDETWRILPVRVAISGGNAVITGHSAQLVKPDLTLRSDAQVLNVTDAATYLTTVEVYRVYRDTTMTDATPNQGYALWEPGLNCIDEPCNQTTKAICINERNAEMGQVSISFGDVCCVNWRSPDRVRAKYLAGEPLDDNGRMTHQMMDIVSKYATALLPMGSCGCDRSDRIIQWWRGMPNSDETERKGRLVTFNEIDSPFGERRGAIYAWKSIQRLKLLGFGVAG